MNLRLLALGGVAACAVALPLAVASAGPVGDEGRAVVGERPGGVRAAPKTADDAVDAAAADTVEGPVADERTADRPRARSDRGRDKGRDKGRDGDKSRHAKVSPADPGRSALPLGLGPATAARCGPELTSPDGIEAQTCVLTQGEDTWARTYFRNATGAVLDSVLSLMGPGGRTVQMRCLVGAEDEPDLCETPRERTRGHLDAYTAVAEFAGASAREGQGPLLLRSGSNSEARTGS
ncbi:hypothetical protein ACGFNV_33325 [Streptomyces sp. NPDC048751]|uniref:hypothetical protein n=1 Tax=Streptomyces sp. NPDC048751 TaxID=3365591 RepID=UPI003721F2BB